ncbi:MAG TPA: SDR family oxidoreductase [Pirellulales bacterium]|jgi:short-subunit dehydrogenase|nr:SDR family oxidoreductase [Pirellulales bacterium]
MKHLKGKRCLLTGAASGIGRALALRLAEEGVHLYLLDVDVAGLQTVVGECRLAGVVAVGRPCDLSQPTQISAAIADLLARWKYIDLLVNNAGVAYYGPTEKMTGTQWDWLMAINLLAPLHITRELLPTLLARNGAHILNVCSISGIVAGGRFNAYHTSKFGLTGFTEALRAEYNRRGIGVTNLCPGPVSSNLYNRAISGRNGGQTVPNPPAWLCASPEYVARRGVWAIKRNKRMVLVTPLARLLYALKRISPALLDGLNHVSRKKRPVAADSSAVELPPQFDLPQLDNAITSEKAAA